MTALSTRIDRVCVHPNGALVVRTAVAAPGPVRVDDLPLLFAADSLRVRPAAGEARDVRARCTVVGPAAAGEAPAAVALAEVAAQLRAARRALASVQARLAIFAQLTPGTPPERHLGLPDAAALTALDAAATERLAALEAERDGLLHRVAALTKAHAAASRPAPDPHPPRFSRGISFTLAGVDAPVDLEIEYFVPSARWVPTYRVDVQGDTATLQTDALVAQASGEDWAGAAIALATADLTRDTARPELMSWRIGTAQPPRPDWRPPPTGLGELFAGYDAAGRVAPPPPPPPVRPAPPVFHDDADDDGMPSAPPARVSEGQVWANASFGGAPEPPMSLDESVAAPPAMAAPMPSRGAPQAKRRKAALPGGGGGPADAPAAEAAVTPPDALSERLRHGWLRLAGADEPHRGTLQPMDPLTQLWSLVADTEVVGIESLRRAIQALEAAGRVLARRALPPGTQAVTGEAWHHRYPAQGRHTVPSDGHDHRISVRTDTAPVQVSYHAVPRHSTDVHRRCTLSTPPGVPFLTGPLQVYIDGDYRVTATLAGQAGRGQLPLALGVEPAVRVVARTAHVEQGTHGLMSQSTRVDHSVLTRVRNGLPVDATVHLYDRLPTVGPDEKEVSVTPLPSAPEPAPTDRDPHGAPLDGGLRWTLTVPAGETREATWRYRVELPAKLELVGGNRRE